MNWKNRLEKDPSNGSGFTGNGIPNREINMTEKKKVLLIRFSSLGDIALIHPVIQKLSSYDYEVDVLTKKTFSSLFDHHQQVHDVLNLEDHHNLLSLISVLKKKKYDHILDLHNNLRTSLIKIAFPFKTVTYKKYRMKRALLVQWKLNLLKGNQVINNYLATLNKLKIPYTDSDYQYRIPFKISEQVKKLKSNQYLCMAPFAKHFTKEWPYYKELVLQLSKKYKIYILGARDEYERAEEFKSKNVINLCGKLSFQDVIGLINSSRLLITNDSGLMHLGSGTKADILSIIGNTVKEFGFFPYHKKMHIVENKKCKCRPCHYHGLTKCPKKHFQCLKEIKPEQVLVEVKKII
jgi:heptosyltransferase-2